MFMVNNQTLKNILPRDGEAYYYSSVLTADKARFYFSQLLHHVAWQHDEVIMFGKQIKTQRKTAWYAEHPFTYTYAKIPRKAKPWIPDLLALKQYVEHVSGETYNSCLLNLYHDGNEGMGWHSDAEKELLHHGAIASLSLGAHRSFAFKHKKDKEKVVLELASGSLLVMKGCTQTHWWHSLPKSKKIRDARINLTFRTVSTSVSSL